ANITAREVVIMGKVQGNLQCSDRVDIRSEGSLTGDVITQRISVEDGAVLKGGVEVRSSEQKSQKPQSQGQVKPAETKPAEQPKAAAAAAGAANFGASHAVTLIGLSDNGTLIRRLRKTWPTGTGVEFRLRAE